MSKKNTTTAKSNTASLNDKLLELASELAYNYFSNSFGNDYNLEIADPKKIFNQVSGTIDFEKRFKKEERVRNILIIGAGVSVDTYKAIPTGLGLTEEMREIFEKPLRTIPFLEQKFLEQESEIKDITNKPLLNFENYLYLLSKFFVPQQEIREKIKNMTGFRYSVSLFNELVAHMLKHSFLDIVINFNFEETLDTAIQREIGSSNYHNIISDGNCVGMETLLVDGRLKAPIYIKPHGTFSHKSTLRFTNRHYFDLPTDIKRMLTDLLRGTTGTKEIERVNLIIVGHRMESIEFNKILDENLPLKSRIYHIDYEPFDKAEEFFKHTGMDKHFLKRAATVNLTSALIYRPIPTGGFSQNKVPPLYKNNKHPLLAGNQLTSTLGELFSVLWRVQYDFFKKSFRPRSIARHEITSYLFYIPKFGLNSLRNKVAGLKERLIDREFIIDKIETHPKYFRNRILVEMFITLNRNNGVLDIAEVLKGRIGDFYNRYAENIEKRPTTIRGLNTIYELLNQFVCDSSKLIGQNDPKALVMIPEYNNGKNIFLLQSEFDKKELRNSTAFKKKIEDICEKIKNHLVRIPVPDTNIPSGSLLPGETIEGVVNNFVTDLSFILLEMHTKLLRNPTDIDNRLLKYGRSITLFKRLITSDLISNFFKFNFLLNYKKEVFNGKNTSNAIPVGGKNIMLSELFRLLIKSWNHHYFVIDQNPANPVHRMFESFSKRKLIHTNLGRTAEFMHLFSKKDWDIYLSVTETGSLLNFLHDITDQNEISKMQDEMENKHFIFICSYETIKQLYPFQDDPEKVLSTHRDYLRVPIGPNKYMIQHLSLLTVPYNHHNHHLSVFLRKIDLTKPFGNQALKNTILGNIRVTNSPNTYNYLFEAIGSMYLYRSGFSNSIDPMYVGTALKEVTSNGLYRDQIKLIEVFAEHLMRAFKFELFSTNPVPIASIQVSVPAQNTTLKLWAKEPYLIEIQEHWLKDFKSFDYGYFLNKIYTT